MVVIHIGYYLSEAGQGQRFGELAVIGIGRRVGRTVLRRNRHRQRPVGVVISRAHDSGLSRRAADRAAVGCCPPTIVIHERVSQLADAAAAGHVAGAALDGRGRDRPVDAGLSRLLVGHVVGIDRFGLYVAIDRGLEDLFLCGVQRCRATANAAESAVVGQRDGDCRFW